MDWQSRTRRSGRAKRVLLSTMLAATLSGCATVRPATEKKSLAHSSPEAAVVVQPSSDKVPAKARSTFLNRSTKATAAAAQPVLPIGFDEGIVIASPAILAQAPSVAASQENTAALPTEQSVIEAQASETVRAGQPVDYFVSTALARHPKILAARQRVAAASNVIPQVKALPDPTFNNTFWPLQDNALQTAGGRVGNQMSVKQVVPFPEKLKAKAVIASREVQIARTEVDAIEREIAESVKLAYYELWFATRAIAIIEETKALVADLTNVAEARYRSGGSQQDVLRAQLENDRLDDQLVRLHRQKQLAQAELATLLQQPVTLLPETDNNLGFKDTPTQIDALIARAEQCNPKLRGLAWEIQRDRGKERLACLQQYPDFNVGLNWGIISDGQNVISPVANGNDNLSFSFGTTLPIWRDKINSGIREAAHRRSSTTRRLEAERDELNGKIRRLIVQADALVQQRDIYEGRIIPRTEDTLKLSIADYRGKRTDFFTLIETYRELLMFETQLARIDATLASTLAQLDRAVGCNY